MKVKFKQKKILLPSLFFTLLSFITTPILADENTERIITMTTTQTTNSTFSFKASASSSSYTSINVDFGDEELVEKTIKSSGTSTVSGTLEGSSVKIYGTTYTLDYLDCSSNELSNLGLSVNNKLTTLKCSSNSLKNLYNLSYCLSLKDLDCSSNKITSLSLKSNSKLYYLYCNSNELTSLNISNNTKLRELNCSNNDLSALDISANTKLNKLYCSNNSLTFSTLPLEGLSLSTFVYSPQNEISIANSIGVKEELDLSTESEINEVATVYTWYTASSNTKLTIDEDYTITNGVTTFLKEQEEKVYCQMTNSTYPDLTLTTSEISITLTTDIKDKALETLNIYPNPVKTELNIDGNTYIKNVQVISIAGAIVYNQLINCTSTTIQTNDLTPGIYILKIEGETDIITRRFVKE